MMWKQFYSAMESTTLPLVAMASFIGAYLLVLIRNYAHARPSDFDGMAALPLSKDEDERSAPEARQ